MTDAERLAIYGTLEPASETRELVAGPLSALLDGAALRRIRFGGIEVLRSIAFLMRDANWGTPPTVLSRLNISEASDSFAVVAEGRIGPDGEALRIGLRIEGSADGRLSVEAEARPERDLATNRTGFVVLHPLAGVIGRPMTVEHTDGTRATVSIPEAIAPDQPIFDIAGLEYQPADGLTARVTMTGDAYEMEDQRNWTDASLQDLHPAARQAVALHAARRRRSFATCRAHRHRDRPRARQDNGARHRDRRPRGPRARDRLACRRQRARSSLAACPALAGLRPQHLTVRLNADEPDLPARIAKGGRIADALGADLTLAFVVPGRDAVRDAASLAAAVAGAGVRPAALVVAPVRDLKSRPSNTLPAGEASLADLVGAVKAVHPGIPVGAGSLTDFTGFNRNPPPPSADFVVHATQAVVHAADDLSVLETFEAFPSIFASLRALAPDRPYRLGPATIGMRENPYAAAVAANPQRLRLAGARRDPRHHARFGAAFALGIMAAAASARVAVVTLADLVGDFGLLDAGQTPTPLAQLLTALAPYAGRPSRAVAVPAGVVALATEAADGPMALVGSLQSAATRLPLPPGRWTSRIVCGTSGAVSPQAVDGTVELLPFAALELRARRYSWSRLSV